jgi:membrane-bound ClpP family serine protease
MKLRVRMFFPLLAASALTGCTILVESHKAPDRQPALELSDGVLNQRRVFVAGDITEASAAETIRQLMFLDEKGSQPITLYLMTPGGDLKAAFAVEHAISLMRAPVNTCAIGECNSAGALLLAAGTGERTAFADSTLVVHGMVLKNKPPKKYVESAQDAYTAFWRQHARLPESWLPIPLGAVLVVPAKEALEYRIIDRIIPADARDAEQSRR